MAENKEQTYVFFHTALQSCIFHRKLFLMLIIHTQPFDFAAENHNGNCEYNERGQRLSTQNGKSHMRTN